MSKAQLQGRISGRVAVYHRAQPAALARVIAMHGALRSAADLTVIAQALPEVDLWLVDLPGHGNAPFEPDSGGFNPDLLANDIATAIAPADCTAPVVVVGESFSGITALRLAGKLANVQHVILLDTPLDTTRMLPAQQVVLDRWETLPAQRALLEALASDFFGLDVHRRQVTPRSYIDELLRCSVKVTMVTGTTKQDSASGVGAFFGEEDRQALAAASHVQVIEIADAGHSLLRVRPEATLEAIAAVLRSTVAASLASTTLPDPRKQPHGTSDMNQIIEQLNQACMRSDWAWVEAASRQWLKQQRFFIPHLFLIRALLQTGRHEEADREFSDLISYKFNIADRLQGFPEIEQRYRDRLTSHYVVSTMRPNISFEGQALPTGTRRWNLQWSTGTQQEFLAEAAGVFDAALPAQAKAPLKTSAVCTFGSCFAANLARMMVDKGMNATNLLIEESINSTYANRVLMEIVCRKPGSDAHESMRAEFGEAFFDTVRSKLSSATHIVLTVGVAPSFFYVESGDFVFAKSYRDLLQAGKIRMRTTTCSENTDNIHRILALMNEVSPDSRKIITVSPVPLAATTEMSSVVVADCVSKSTLRAAVHEVVSSGEKVTYFPAFEVVRWLSGYTKTPVFGADDQNSRHVSNWVVEFIVGSFIDRFFDPAA